MILVTDPRTLHVMQGQLRLSDSRDDVLTGLLGSCVAACLRDPVLRIGGMNHFLLAGHDPRDSSNIRYGARSMEELINAILRRGAERARLEVWLFGGANVIGAKTGIGAANAEFARTFVRDEGFTLRGSDLGGSQGRRVRFHPYSGTTEVVPLSKPPSELPTIAAPQADGIEFF